MTCVLLQAYKRFFPRSSVIFSFWQHNTFFLSDTLIFQGGYVILWKYGTLTFYTCFSFCLLASEDPYIKSPRACTNLYKQPWMGSLILLSVKKLWFFFFFWFRRAMRFSSNKLFVVVCFCYAACFSWQLSCTNTYLFNATSSRVVEHSHIKSLYHEAVPAFVLVLKPCQHSFLPWSNICTCICYEVTPSFAFVMKLY